MANLQNLSVYAITNILEFFDDWELIQYRNINKKFKQAEQLGQGFIWKLKS